MADHLYGHPCDMKALKELCDEKKIFLIEDCAEATGRTFSGTWYNNWQDFRDRIDGQPFYMRRQ